MTDRVPRLHVIVPDAVAGRPDFTETAAGLLERGGGELALHLRLKEATGRRLHDLARELAGEARRLGGWCVVNERVDVALTAGAQGVQLGRGALPVARTRGLVGDDTMVGASVHGREEAEEAVRQGANFLLLGTIFDTPSHPGVEGAGPDRVAACRDLSAPVVAIGGMTPGRVSDVRTAGAHGVASLRGVWEAADPGAAVDAFLREL